MGLNVILRPVSRKNLLGPSPKQNGPRLSTSAASSISVVASSSLRAMAAEIVRRSLKASNFSFLRTLTSFQTRSFSNLAASVQPESDGPSSSFTFSAVDGDPNSQRKTATDDNIFIKGPKKDSSSKEAESVTMPMSFMTGSIVGKRFYQKVTTREAEDGNGWSVMLDYRTLKTPSKRPLKCPTLALAKAIAAEWEYQVLYPPFCYSCVFCVYVISREFGTSILLDV